MKQHGPIDERSLLLTLEESSRLVSHSHDPHETLTNIVRLIQQRQRIFKLALRLARESRHHVGAVGGGIWPAIHHRHVRDGEQSRVDEPGCHHP